MSVALVHLIFSFVWILTGCGCATVVLYDVLRCRSGVFDLIDEFFVEVHFQEPERHVCQPTLSGCSKLDAIRLVASLRERGVAAHFWV